MCDPVVMAGIQIATGVASFVGQQQSADAQEAANEQNRELIIRNQNLQIRALQNAEEEDAKRTSEALIDNQRAADSTRATALVSAGESGVSGLSVDALLGDITFQENLNKQDILETQDFAQRQRQLDREGLGITAQSQVNQLPLVEFPSFFDSAVNTGTSSFETFQNAKDRKAMREEFKQ